MTDELLDQLARTFLEELEDRATVMSATLRRPQDGSRREEDLLDLYRAAHNIKGAARAVGADDIQAVCHELETLFSLVREARRGLAPHEIEQALALIERAQDLARARRAPASPAPASSSSSSSSPPSSQPSQPSSAAQPERSTLRVRLDRIDAVIGAAGAAFGASRRLDRAVDDVRDLAALVRGWRADPALAQHKPRHEALLKQLTALSTSMTRETQALQRTLARLNDDAHATRMVPAADVWQGAQRLALDLARSSGKHIDVVEAGAVVELDREVAEQLREPVLQLVKNACDHGLELPFERVASGKATTGTLRLQASLDGDQVQIAVDDDGRGIDVAAVKDRAHRRGLAVPDDDEAALELVFHPGLSTAARVTDVSGRGIGLDAVRHAVARLHGRVVVRSTPQRGTRFELRVPLTLGVVRVLTVRVGDRRLALPASQVTQLLRRPAHEVVDVDGRGGVFVGGGVIATASLATLLGIEARPPAGRLPIVVVTAGARRVALVVDELLEEGEALLQPLPPRVAGLRGVSAVTQGSHGELVPVLAVSALLERAADVVRGDLGVPRAEQQQSRRRLRVLVVDDSITTRTLTQSILATAGYDVVVAADGDAAWAAVVADDFDGVVSDVDMPGKSGLELTAAIRSSKRHAALPVVLLSALGSEADQRRGLEAGADAYLVKSRFDQGALLETLSRLLPATT